MKCALGRSTYYYISVEVDRSDQDCDLAFEMANDSFKEMHNTRVESEGNAIDVYCIAANETAMINNSHFGMNLRLYILEKEMNHDPS